MDTFCFPISSVQEILFNSRGGVLIRIMRKEPDIILILFIWYLDSLLDLFKLNVITSSAEIIHRIIEEPEDPKIGRKPLKGELVIDMPNKSQGNPENRKPLSVSTKTQANGNNTKALNMKFFLSLK